MDGVVLVDQEFVVEGQHTWVTFPIGLEPGRHTVRAVTEWNEIERSVDVPKDGPVYAKINYWHYESEGRELTWDVQDTPFTYD